MKYDFIVARYNEDIKWLEEIDTSDTNIFLYNKGKEDVPIIFPKPFVYKKLKNIGRDPHSYIYHIVENWDNLSEYIIFTQGNPFDHCSNLFDKIESHTSEDFLYLHSTRILREEISCGWEQKVFDQRDDKEGVFQFSASRMLQRSFLAMKCLNFLCLPQVNNLSPLKKVF